VAALDLVDVGDHVCWPLGPGDDFHAAARVFEADGELFGDKVVILGPAAPGTPPRLDAAAAPPGRGTADGLIALAHREAAAAAREGYRSLRLLTQMGWWWPAGAAPEAVAQHELRLDELAADGRAVLVCAYPAGTFGAAALGQAQVMHPQHLGTPGSAGAAFKVFSAGEDGWHVTGVVDADGAEAFATALRGLLTRHSVLRLRCAGLEWMDAAGMTVLARAAHRLPGHRIVVHGANDTVRRCWTLLGYDAPEIPVELAP
jgi:anti-anti-sigma regulatory factor